MIRGKVKEILKETIIYRHHKVKIYAKQKNINRKVKCIYNPDKYSQFEKMLCNLKLNIDINSRFIYFINEDIYFYNKNSVLGNMPIDYSLIVDNSLENLIEINKRKNNQIASNNVRLLNYICDYVKKITYELKKSDNLQLQNKADVFERMLNKKAENIKDALQRILFWNQLLHQSGHTLIGLGRLDMILDRLCNISSDADLENFDEIIKDFINTLHKYYYWKSCSLFGDTGQLIVLGGLDKNHCYFCNDLTYLFLNAIAESGLPEPKALLRVSKKMPKKLLDKACESIAKGGGSPLLSNDDIIINKLVNVANYSEDDAYNYVSSACWEPFITGKSLDQNNVKCINFLQPLNEAITDSFNTNKSLEKLKENYQRKLASYCEKLICEANKMTWEEDPILTLFCAECAERNLGIHEGGALYNNYGFTSTGLANTVNSFINMQKYCFVEKKYSIQEISNAIKCNNLEQYFSLEELKNQLHSWGNDHASVLEWANWIIKITGEILEKEKTRYGGIFKFGLSSPSYIDCGATSLSSMDGRKYGDPLSTHISSISSVPYTEFVSFAAELDYNSVINGNVIDLILSPLFIENNYDKFVDFISLSIKRGFFQFQMNVISASTLIEAQKNPQNYLNLIVRVWGFSAYFNELPVQYQNVLISRALENEKQYA